jgi:hypothetical protein
MADWSRIVEALGQSWPARMGRDAYQAARLPGDVWQGNVSMTGPDGRTNPEVINRSADLAGLVTGGSYAAAPAMKNASGMGIKAFHGSPAQIEKFDRPAYFSPSRDYAAKFGNVHEVDISPKNPLYTNNEALVEQLRSFPERADELRKAGHDAVILSGSKNSMEPLLLLGGYKQPQIYSLDPSIVRNIK